MTDEEKRGRLKYYCGIIFGTAKALDREFNSCYVCGHYYPDGMPKLNFWQRLDRDVGFGCPVCGGEL